MHVKVWEKIFTKLFERLKNKGTRKIILSNTKNIKKTFKIVVISVNEIPIRRSISKYAMIALVITNINCII